MPCSNCGWKGSGPDASKFAILRYWSSSWAKKQGDTSECGLAKCPECGYWNWGGGDRAEKSINKAKKEICSGKWVTKKVMKFDNLDDAAEEWEYIDGKKHIAWASFR